MMKTNDAIALVMMLLAIGRATGQSECYVCESLTYLDTDFTDLDLDENDNCVLGQLSNADSISCPLGYYCTVTDGTIWWFVEGYGFLRARLFQRDCVGGSNFVFPADNNYCYDGHVGYIVIHQLVANMFKDRKVTNFEGSICGCEDGDYCNNKPAELIEVSREHMPGKDVPGLQCLYCSHQKFHDLTYAEFDDPNPACPEADIEEGGVYYQTCKEGGVCGVTGGYLAYNTVGTNTTFFTRDCMYGLEEYSAVQREDGFTCLSRSDSAEVVGSHLFDNPADRQDIDFRGEVCFCSTDFCELPDYEPVSQGRNTARGLYMPLQYLFYVFFALQLLLSNYFS